MSDSALDLATVVNEPIAPESAALHPTPHEIATVVVPAIAPPLEPLSVPTTDPADDSTPKVGWRFALAAILTIPVVVLEVVDLTLPGTPVSEFLGRGLFLALQAALCLPVVLVCGWPILKRSWGTIRRRRPDFFTLVGMAILAAMTYSLVAVAYDMTEISLTPKLWKRADKLSPEVVAGLEEVAPFDGGVIAPFFEGAAMMVVLVLFGLSLEERAQARSGESIKKLMRLTPVTARVILPDDREEERPLDQVQVGDIVRVSPGQRIPVDGLIREGTTTVDESVLTGEALRSGRGPGMTVMAGTENGLGVLTLEVLRVNADTAMAHVIAIIARAHRARLPLQRTADKIAVRLIPLSIVVAAATYALWMLLGPPDSHAIASVCSIGVLMAMCPVALGLAAPTAVVAGMLRASRSGILFRDGAALERLAGVNTILLDKTGTLTEGTMKFIGVETNPGVTPEELLALAAAVERGSIHPIGLAIVWETVNRKLIIPPAEGVEEIPGRGVHGVVNGHRIAVGRHGFIQESGAHLETMFGMVRTHWNRGHSVVFVGRDDRWIGLIVMNDPLRAGTDAAVSTLRSVGVETVLVTGDHEGTGTAVAKQIGIEKVFADTLPAEKFAIVQSFKNQGRSVAMCGDGVNDAPALAAADVGIAMGTGSEIAVSTAGVALAKPDLRKIMEGRVLSEATVKAIRRNLNVAFIYTILAVPIAGGVLLPLGGGLVSPVWQAAGMAITSLIVIGNSQRLKSL